MKEYLSATEVAKIWGCSKQRVFTLCKENKVKTNGEKPPKIPFSEVFYGRHKDVVLWGEPYETENGWEIKKYTADGEDIYSVTKK